MEKEQDRDNKACLFADVLEWRRRADREADEEDVGLWVGERTQAIVVFLTCRIEEAQSVGLAADHHCYGVVIEHLQCKIQF